MGINGVGDNENLRCGQYRKSCRRGNCWVSVVVTVFHYISVLYPATKGQALRLRAGICTSKSVAWSITIFIIITSWHGNAVSIIGPLCKVDSPHKWPIMLSFDAFWFGNDTFSIFVTLLHWHLFNNTSAPVPVKKPWSIWVKVWRKYTGTDKQRVLMHGHQGWNVRHGLCHIYMRYIYVYIYIYMSCL